MIWRALERVVERDVDTKLLRFLHEATKIFQVAERGMNGHVAALGRTNRPRAAEISGSGSSRVVPTLAMRDADRMNRREVEDIESEVHEVGQARFDVAERPVSTRDGGCRTRKQLVPGTEHGSLAIGFELEGRMTRGLLWMNRPHHRQGEIAIERSGETLLHRRTRVLQDRAHATQNGRRLLQPRRALRDEARAFQELARQVLTCFAALLEILAPGAEQVGPRFDGVFPATHRIQLELAEESIAIVIVAERPAPPIRIVWSSIQEAGVDLVVAVLEDVRGHLHALADHTLHRVAAAIQRGQHSLDREPCQARRTSGNHPASELRGSGLAGQAVTSELPAEVPWKLGFPLAHGVHTRRHVAPARIRRRRCLPRPGDRRRTRPGTVLRNVPGRVDRADHGDAGFARVRLRPRRTSGEDTRPCAAHAAAPRVSALARWVELPPRRALPAHVWARRRVRQLRGGASACPSLHSGRSAPSSSNVSEGSEPVRSRVACCSRARWAV
jgi:hypothetical protein